MPGMYKLRFIVLFFCLALLLIPSFYLAQSLDYYRAEGSDFFSLWLAPHLILQGRDPYRADIWIPAHDTYGSRWISDSTFLYPLPLALLLVPFGILPLDLAAILWVFILFMALCFTIWKLIATWRPDPFLPYLLPALAGIVLFRPTFLTFLVGQIEILFLLCLVGVIVLWQHNAWLEGGMLASVVLVKPQIGLPLIGLLFLWLLARQRWSGLFGIGLGALSLFILGTLIDIHWVSTWLSIGQGKVSGVFEYTPTAWGVSATICHIHYPCTTILGGLFTIIVLAASLLIILRAHSSEPMHVMSVVIPVALLVTPYLWSYTQVLLIIPILHIMGRLHNKGLPYLLVATYPLLMAILAFIALFIAVALGSDVWSAVVPLASLLLLGFLF